MIFSIKDKLFPIARSILSFIGLTVFSQMLILYGKHRSNKEINKQLILLGLLCSGAAVFSYISMFTKYIIKMKPAKRISIDRWFTVNPFIPFFIVIGILSAVVLFIVGLWPVYNIYGAIFCVLTFLVLKNAIENIRFII